MRLSALAAAATLLLAAPALAQRPGVWVAGTIGVNSYAMADVNELASNVYPLNGPLDAQELDSGWSYGGQLGYTLAGGMSVVLGLERLEANLDWAAEGRSVSMDVPANLLTLGLDWSLAPAGRVTPGLGAAFGWATSSSRFEFDIPGYFTQSVDIGGSAFVAEALGRLEWAVSKGFVLAPEVGYRFCRAQDVEAYGREPVYTADGSPFTLDWSGLMARLQFRVYL